MKKSHAFNLAPLSASILMALAPLTSQAVTYDSGLLDFTYEGGNLWGPNSDYTFSKSAFLGTEFGKTVLPTIGYINHTNTDLGPLGSVDTYTGGEMKTTIFPGKVGFDISTQIKPGHISIDYGLNATLALPDTIMAGSSYSFAGSSKTNANHTSMNTQFSSLSVTEDLVINVPSSTQLKGCYVVDCKQATYNTGISMDPFDIFSYNRNGDGNVVMHGQTQSFNFGKTYDIVISPEPLSNDVAEAGMKLGSITPYTPVLNTAVSSTDSHGVLHSASDKVNEGHILDVTVDLAPLGYGPLAVLGLPTPNLQVSVADVISASGTLYDLNASAFFNLAQDFTFDPNLSVSLAFDHPISAVEHMPLGSHSYETTSNSFTVSMNALKNWEFIFDKSTTVTPTFMLKDSFTNKTDLVINGSLDFGVLKGSLDVLDNNIAHFDGFNYNLANGQMADINIFNQTYSLDFKTLVGKAFNVLVTGLVDDHIANWSGGGLHSTVWSSLTNWQDSDAPKNGDAVVFDSQSIGNKTSVNDYITTINGITFLHGSTGFTLSGNALTNTGSILNQSSTVQTITTDITAGAHQHWDGGMSGLKFTGKLDLGGYDLALSNVNVQNNQGLLIGSNKAEGLTLETGSALSLESLTIGKGDHGSGKVYVDGAATTVQTVHDLNVADDGAGYLFVQNGAHVSSANATLGSQQHANAYIAIDGTGSKLSADKLMNLGQDGVLNLKLTQGGGLSSADARVAIKATADVNISLHDSASQWTVAHNLDMTGAGRTRLDIANGAALVVGANGQTGTFQLGSTVSTNRTDINTNTGGSMTVNGNMLINQNATIHLNGSATDPSLKVSGVTNLNNGANLSLAGAEATFDKGLNVRGTLNAMGNSQINGAVTLTQSTGLIETKNGSLAFADAVNYNTGKIKTDAGATTQFLGSLQGTGNFYGPGTVDIEGIYSLGSSPTQIDFGGGNLKFGLTSILDLDIVGNLTTDILGNHTAYQYDQLTGINTLSFSGELMLNFTSFIPTPDSRFQLFNFASFAGSFDPSDIVVAGFDKNRFDFSHLSVDGSFSVKAVPLPAGVWLFASGLLAMTGFRFKNRDRAFV